MKNIIRSLFLLIVLILCFSSCMISPDDIILVEPLGDYKFGLLVNLDYSDLALGDVYVIGWENDWDNGQAMHETGEGMLAGTVLEAFGNGIKEFVVTNEAGICNAPGAEWLWLETIYELGHPLVIPSIWLNPEADPKDFVIGFKVTGPKSLERITEPVNKTTTTTTTITTTTIPATIPTTIPATVTTTVPATVTTSIGVIVTTTTTIAAMPPVVITSTIMPTTTTVATTTVVTTTALIIHDDILLIEPLGDDKFRLLVNLDYSSLDPSDVCVNGWEENDEWDECLVLKSADELSYVEGILEASSEGIKSFVVTNEAGSHHLPGAEWLWLEVLYGLDHPLVIPNIWLNPEADPKDFVIGFKVTGSDTFEYIAGPVNNETTTTTSADQETTTTVSVAPATTSTTTVVFTTTSMIVPTTTIAATTTLPAPEVVFFEPRELTINQNTEFYLQVEAGAASDIFAIAFDVDYDTTGLKYLGLTEGDVLSQGCQTTLMDEENPPGKLIVSLTRMGLSCGSVSGPGTLMTLNFKSLNQSGKTSVSFSNNYFCILEPGETDCNYDSKGQWTEALITVK